MPDIKVVDTLEDWFDVLVVLAPAQGPLSEATTLLATRFADHRRVYIVRPDGAEGACVSDQIEPGDSWLVHCPGGDTAHQADSLWRFMRDTKVRRPLIWVDSPGYSQVLERFSEDFKILHARLNASIDSALAEACDLVVGETERALSDAIGGVDYRGQTAVWSASSGFAALEPLVAAAVNRLLMGGKSLNILVLYDDTFTHIKPIQEHLKAFSKHSRHRYFYFPVRADPALFKPYENEWPAAWDLDDYDAVIWHFCLRAAHTDNIDPLVVNRLTRYSGLKILFIQDDYDTTLTTWSWIEQAGLHLVMTCIPAYGIPYAFPEWKPGVVEFLQTHTGFVPEDDMDRFIVPMEDRTVHLAYRGRTLPFRYGSLGREKYMIGVQMKELAAERGVPADIAVDDAGRIYGDDWYRFTAGARATLASETGSHVFDFDGSLTALSEQAERDGVPYDIFFAEHLAEKEQQVRMNQVSPRIFEAVRLKTALVCFEGEYSGAIMPDEHYIPLKKDFSNAEEVFEKLADVDFLKAMTERAYRDVIESDNWSHAAFIRRFDGIVESRLLRSSKRELMTATIARRDRGAEPVAVPRHTSFEYVLNTGILRQPLTRVPFTGFMGVRAQEELSRSTYKTEQMDTAPEGAILVGQIEAQDFEAVENSETRMEGQLVHLVTPADSWHSGPRAELNLTGVDFDNEHCWIRAVFRNVSGEPLFGAFDMTGVGPLFERSIPNTEGEVEVTVKLISGQNAVLVRTGPKGGHGRCDFVGADILTAPAYQPGVVRILHRLTEKASPILWPEGGPTREALQIPFGRTPPAAGARRIYAISGEGNIYPGGGQVTAIEGGSRIETSPAPWSYAAAIDLSLPSLDFQREHHWISVAVRATNGYMRVALWSKVDNRIIQERIIRPQAGPQSVIFQFPNLEATSLLFRKGQGDAVATAEVLSVELIASIRYPEWLYEMGSWLAGQADTPESALAAAPSEPPAAQALELSPELEPAEASKQAPAPAWRRLLGLR